MTTRQEAIAACLQLPDVYEDYPFDDFNWTAIRHRANQKIFGYDFRTGKSYLDQCKSTAYVGRFLAADLFRCGSRLPHEQRALDQHNS